MVILDSGNVKQEELTGPARCTMTRAALAGRNFTFILMLGLPSLLNFDFGEAYDTSSRLPRL